MLILYTIYTYTIYYICYILQMMCLYLELRVPFLKLSFIERKINKYIKSLNFMDKIQQQSPKMLLFIDDINKNGGETRQISEGAQTCLGSVFFSCKKAMISAFQEEKGDQL